jgi:predicted dehydrogenase
MGQAAHLRNYATLPNCELAALAEIRPQLGQAVAQRYGVPKVYEDHRAMLDAEDLDGIVAIQQFQNHVRLVPELLERGIPLLTEKPLADSLESGETVAAAARRTGTPLYLAYHKRSDPATAYAKSQIAAWQSSGEVGKLRYLRISMPPGDWSMQGFASNLSTDERYDAGPANYQDPYFGFVNYYIHQVNLFRFLLGEDYEVIFADPAGVTLAIRSDSGVSGTLEMATHSSTLDWQEEAFVAFERGWIRLNLPAPLALDQPGRVTVFRDPGRGEVPTTTSPTLPHFHAMRCQAQHFLSAIEGSPTPLCGAEDALKDLRVAQSYIELRGA